MVIAHALAAVAVWLIPEQTTNAFWDWHWRATACTVLVASLNYQFVMHVTRSHKNAITRLAVDAQGNWKLSDRSGEEYTAEVLGSSTVTSRCAILVFKTSSKRRRSVILMADSLEAEPFRSLRQQLTVWSVSRDG